MATKTDLDPRYLREIARTARCSARQAAAAADLLADGATVPFIARYRKEVTGGLDDAQIETIAKQRVYFVDLGQRREAIIDAIDEQGKLTDVLFKAIDGATTKAELEDLYLPYKPRRRTRAQIARERGLEPLADLVLQGRRDRGADPEDLARPHVAADRDVPDVEAALAGARDIIAEQVAEDAANRRFLRDIYRRHAMLAVKVVVGKADEGQTYRDYFDHSEPASRVASHRLLAILRGEREGILKVALEVEHDRQIQGLRRKLDGDQGTRCSDQVAEAVTDGYRRLLRPSITNEIRGRMKTWAEDEAIAVFRANLEALLLQPPLGQRAVMGLDPGYRTGCKLAVVDGTGKVLQTGVIYPVPPRAKEESAREVVLEAVRRHGVRAIAVGNGTASRETEQFARGAMKGAGETDVAVVIVPETGASVYSASELAREELPDLDVSLRGAVSIARRLQDPLAELVKIEPRSLGVGQYQHDVDDKRLAEELDLTVEAAVNRVGVELNTASAALLRRVAGITPRMATNIVTYRDENARFRARRNLLRVRGVGPKAYEQAAGFLRIRGGSNPLDETAVHPERYKLVERMARKAGVPVMGLVGNPAAVARLDFDQFEDAERNVGRYTLDDIRAELERPGRDPRPEFEAPAWRDDVTSIDDLKEGMVVEGRVSNVTKFGAFVDIGVKQDGLIHVSQLSSRWVGDPMEVVRVGELVRVKVIEVDHKRNRIGLSRKAVEEP